MHRHNFVTPASLGFDSDGSILICDGENCPAYVVAQTPEEYERQQRRLSTKHQERAIRGILVASHFIAAVPFFFGAPLCELALFIPIGLFDVIIIRDALKSKKQTGEGK